MLAGCPQAMLSSYLHPEKPGAGQGIHCRFFLTFREACPAVSNSRLLAVLEANPARAACSKDLYSTGTQGSPHPAQRLAGESCPRAILQHAKQLLNFLLLVEQPLPPQAGQPIPSPQLCS